MNELLAALIGAVVGGVLSLVGSMIATRSAARDTLSAWRRERQADALETFTSRARRLAVGPQTPDRRPPVDLFIDTRLDDALTGVRLWAPAYAADAAAVYGELWDMATHHGVGRVSVALEGIKAIEARMRTEFGIESLPELTRG